MVILAKPIPKQRRPVLRHLAGRPILRPVGRTPAVRAA